MNIVYGFGGMRSDGEVLSISPSIPPQWKSYRFQIVYRGSVIKVEVDKSKVSIQVIEGPVVQLKIFGKLYKLDQRGISVKI
jgi:maltose phosphorylase